MTSDGRSRELRSGKWPHQLLLHCVLRVTCNPFALAFDVHVVVTVSLVS
jgi:hypothetical protein